MHSLLEGSKGGKFLAVECLNLHTSVLTLKIVMVISHGDSKDQRILDKVDMNLQFWGLKNVRS